MRTRLAVAGLVAALSLISLQAQVRSPYREGAAGLIQKLQRLTTTASAMHTGAHPDDEDSALIARLARGDHARVAYLSLNRGEGGQNVLGPEFYEALGVIRTEELLQARALDGGEQFFTRVVDFGYTVNMPETERKWGGRDVPLGDMVRVLRTYRPLVVASRFSGTSADGHGNHQLAGALTPIAVKAAADPAQFPEQIAEGLRPWQVKKLYVGMRFGPNQPEPPTLTLQTGVFDPALGRTYAQIAAEGRSQHKTQEMGGAQLHGPQTTGLRLVESWVPRVEREQSVFDGIDTSIAGLARLAGLPDGAIAAPLGVMASSASEALSRVDVRQPTTLLPVLARGLTAAREARAALATLSAPEAARAEAAFLLDQEIRQWEDALVHASGVHVEALATSETVTPGGQVSVSVRAFVPAAPDLTVTVAPPTLTLPIGWTQAPLAEAPQFTGRGFMARFLREQPSVEASFAVTAAADARITQPYWLEAPARGDVFAWPADAPRHMPFAPAVASGRTTITVAGTPVEVTVPVQFRIVDPVRGELRRNLEVVPALSVQVTPGLDVVALSSVGASRQVTVRIDSQAPAAISGEVSLDMPSGWTATPARAAFTIEQAGQSATATFAVAPPKGVAQGSHVFTARAVSGGRTYAHRLRTIAYPHIQTHRMYEPARFDLRLVDVTVAPVTVGYIMGTGDEVPEGLKRLGVPVTLLTPNDVASGDLARYDTIMVGVRASEVRPDFVANHGRLLDYVRNGGTLIVQEQHEVYTQKKLTPFPAEIGSRVTDEDAPVTILEPTHPVFTTPNRITLDDFRNWRQERNAYGFQTFDPQYTPLLESHDPWDTEQKGGLVYARLGKGHYVYSAYSWFRELPDGVPGAYRIVANLISLGSKRP
ncbi:PIG-L domain-containing protein [Luteitalea sp. TBR-22]|uniref:PIG-L family deacetylase n=1 Tax=Luteitalea sp. TBR-22 TaxID=2802971 RepID=UPI001AF7EB86|nr:PIG-L family deacetylase [Luteitalea sp. TBR-22]BCS32801.1 PIG-L domain-containing protein [Luteitalea sp. TBR-22]